jgi:hypothetical protein
MKPTADMIKAFLRAMSCRGWFGEDGTRRYRAARRRLRLMRISSLLAIVAMVVSQTAAAGVVRHSAIPESFWGTWSPIGEACDKADKSIAMSAMSYVSAEATCTVDWVSETPGARGPIYSAHLQCSTTAERVRDTASNVILWPKDADQISVGADFSNLKDYRRCPASAPAVR